MALVDFYLSTGFRKLTDLATIVHSCGDKLRGYSPLWEGSIRNPYLTLMKTMTVAVSEPEYKLPTVTLQASRHFRVESFLDILGDRDNIDIEFERLELQKLGDRCKSSGC